MPVTARLRMNVLRYQLLAGTAFTEEQNTGFGWGDARDMVAQALHRR